MTLSAAERETVILMDDEVDIASITTYQRTMLTKLERNPAAQKIEDYSIEGTKGAKFLVPAKLINIRRPTKLSADQRAAKTFNLRSRTP